MYDPIYSANVGLCGFRCRVGACKKVVPTYRGIQMHCWRKHGLKAQMEMNYEAKASSELKSVRVEHHEERGLFYDEHEGELRNIKTHCGEPIIDD